jgi:hypothetical protein
MDIYRERETEREKEIEILHTERDGARENIYRERVMVCNKETSEDINK